MREAFAAMEAALMGGNVSQVAADFNCCQVPKDLDDQVISLMGNTHEKSVKQQTVRAGRHLAGSIYHLFVPNMALYNLKYCIDCVGPNRGVTRRSQI